jgi:hypothetical protein
MEPALGEAKRKAAWAAGLKRGLVVSAPVEIQGSELRIRESRLDPQELRFALLFWDRLAWPKSRVVAIQSDADAQFLEDIGIMTRPLVEARTAGIVADLFAAGHFHAFLDLDRKEPGAWALAQGENSFLLNNGKLSEGRGFLVELHRAIPVPDRDIPLADILEFKEKRRDELGHLRDELDSSYSILVNSADSALEIQRLRRRIESACTDLLMISKETRRPFRLTDVRISFQVQIDRMTLGALVGWAVGQQFALSELGAIVGGVSGITVSSDFGIIGLRRRSNPYRYVYHFHNELF